MPTAKDVAKLAGVSPATVSRALANFHYVNEKTRERVIKAAKELNYRPDEIARSLRLRRTNLIGMCVSSIETVFFTEIARAAERTAHEHNYNLIVCNTEEDPRQEERYLDILERQQVAGVILAPAPGNAKHLDDYVNKGLCVVLINRQIDRLTCASVTSNDEQISYDCVTTLINQGRKRIAAITGFKNASTTQARLQGYRRALKDAGLDELEKLEVCGSSDLQSGYQATRELMTRENPPDALFVFNDLMIQGSILALQDLGIKWPNQVDVTGFGAFAVAQLYNPPLMLIDQPTHEMGQRAVELLIDQIENPNANEIERIVLENKIIARETWGTWRHPNHVGAIHDRSIEALPDDSVQV